RFSRIVPAKHGFGGSPPRAFRETALFAHRPGKVRFRRLVDGASSARPRFSRIVPRKCGFGLVGAVSAPASVPTHDNARVRVSVIIPAHDAAATLGRALEALAAQDLGEPFEVI